MVGLCLTCLPSAFSEVDINFSTDTDQWQRNGVYDLTVILNNLDGSSIAIAGAQVDYNYESADFKDIAPTLIQDYIIGYDFATDLIDTSTEGVVLYSKLIAEAASPNYFALVGSGTRNVVKYRYRVMNNAALGVSNFIFRNEAVVLERYGGGGSGSCLGSANDANITIAEDTTPPNTYASPAGTTIRYGDSTLVALKEVSTPAYDDLQTVYYSVGYGSAPNPTVTGDWVVKDEMVQLPYNTEAHPGKFNDVLKFFGRDMTGNLEFGGTNWHTENYMVDVVRPGFSANPVRIPVRVKLGDLIMVMFTVNEPMGSDPLVSVNSHAFTKHGTSTGNYYKYTYTVPAGEMEGNRTIRIEITDEVGNQTVDTSLSILIDLTAPIYTPVSILPKLCEPGQTLTIKFNASETLQTGGGEAVVVSMAPGYGGGNAVYQGESGVQYTYTYVVNGSEGSTFIQVHGYDLVGNDSYNTEGWGNIVMEGNDQYGNWGESTGAVEIYLKREAY